LSVLVSYCYIYTNLTVQDRWEKMAVLLANMVIN